jgi:predicted secreted protein
MTTHTGKEGIVKVGATPAAIAEVKEWSLDVTGETTDDTTMNTVQSNGGWRTHKHTLKAWEGSVSCLWDESDATGQETLDVGATVALKLYPEGDGSGDTFFSGDAIVTAVNRKATLDGMVEASFSFKGTGALAQTTV